MPNQVLLTFSGDVKTGKDSHDTGAFPHAVHQANIALASSNILCTSYNDINAVIHSISQTVITQWPYSKTSRLLHSTIQKLLLVYNSLQ